jgi:hypothetical protein
MALTVKQLAMGALQYNQLTAAGDPAPNQLYKCPTGKSAMLSAMSFVNNAATTSRSAHLFFLANGLSQTTAGNYVKIGCYNGFAPDAGGEVRYLITDEITMGAGDRIFGYSGAAAGDNNKIDFIISGVERDV